MEEPIYLFSDDLLLNPRVDPLPSPGFSTPSGFCTPGIYFPTLCAPLFPTLATPTALQSGQITSYFQLTPSQTTPSQTIPAVAAAAVAAPPIISAPVAAAPSSKPEVSESGAKGRLRAALNLFPGEKFITKQSLDGGIISCTENLQKYLGYEASTLRSTSIYQLIHPDDVSRVLDVHHKFMQQTAPASLTACYRVLRRTGDYASLQSVFLLETDGASTVVFCISVDLQPPKNSPTPSFFSEGELASGSSAEEIFTPLETYDSGYTYQTMASEYSQQVLSEEYDEDDHDHDHEDSDESRHSLSPPAISHFAERHAHLSEGSDEGSDDETYGSSSSHKIRAKPRGRIVQKAIGRTSHGNPKRERRMRRPPFGEVCGECNAPESTEWRKGPTPDHLLCNACGLRYTRKVKKEQRAKKLLE